MAEYCTDLGIILAMLQMECYSIHRTAWELKDAGIVAVVIPVDFAQRNVMTRLETLREPLIVR
ncbi:MAG: hypothetical protein QXR45_07680 [Candidatus Bathyarchaeia archaeon]